MGRIKTPAWIDVAIYLRRHGQTLSEIAAQCDTSINQVSYHLMIELGREEYESLLITNGDAQTRERSQEIADRLNAGESPKSIASDLGVSPAYVYNFKHSGMQSFMRRIEEEAERTMFNLKFWQDRGHDVPPADFEVLESRV